MTVRQMVVYYTVKNTFKTRQTKMPKYVYDMISAPFDVRTRMADTESLRDTRKMKKGIPTSSFIPRAIILWNSLPTSIRMEKLPSKFEEELLVYVKRNY